MAGYLRRYFDALIDITSINHIGDAVDWPVRMGVALGFMWALAPICPSRAWCLALSCSPR